MEASYDENLVDDRAGGLHKRAEFHESIICRPLFPIKPVSHVVRLVLHVRLEIVLKLYQILLSKTQDNIEASTARVDQEENSEWESKKLL